MVKYYSTQRPVSPGTFPREGAGRIVNFDNKQFCEEIGRDAWGYIEYEEPLSAAQMEAYELTMGGMKKFWCVTTSVNDRGEGGSEHHQRNRGGMPAGKFINQYEPKGYLQ